MEKGLRGEREGALTLSKQGFDDFINCGVLRSLWVVLFKSRRGWVFALETLGALNIIKYLG